LGARSANRRDPLGSPPFPGPRAADAKLPGPVAATDYDPVALQHFELTPEPVPAEVLGGESLEVWALRLSGGTVREVLTTDPVQVETREYVFAVPLDVMGHLARALTEFYERRRGATL
jgi:hypothetical protein